MFYQQNKEEIGELTGLISRGVSGSQVYLGSLQNVTTELWSRLSAEEQESYADLAREWSNRQPPKHIQAKSVIFHSLQCCYALTGHSSQCEVSWSGVSSGLSAPATCDADMW